ncbi:MAG TPA: LON peptidase substrate-binding domain-containing protein [Polyangiaceae bacterium]|jgi:ATP-dependent Lon protease
MAMGELKDDLRRALDDVPVFPLPQAVLFPGALLPLHIFEPRYRAMLAHCLATHRLMVIARIADEADVDGEGRPRFAAVGGLGLIVEHRPLPDGRSNIVLQGKARVALEERPADTPYRRVRATPLVDLPGTITDADRTALFSAATIFASSLETGGDVKLAFPPNASPAEVADLCAQHLLFDPDTRQAVLEERDIAERVRRVIAELAMQQRTIGGKARSELN